MTDRLLERFDTAVTRAARFKSGTDPTPVLDALGYALWLSVLGELDRARPDRLDTLRQVGRRALLGLSASRDVGSDEEDPEAARQVEARIEAVARAGLQALDGTPRPPDSPVRLHPPDHTLARMFHGDTDGLTAGRNAAHVLVCSECQTRIDALHFSSGLLRGVPVAAAAAAPSSLRAPSTGRVVATHTSPALEAVLFDDRRLAVYADSHAPLRLVADGVTTEETLGGYWIGRLADGTQGLDATVHLGGDTLRWVIVVGEED